MSESNVVVNKKILLSINVLNELKNEIKKKRRKKKRFWINPFLLKRGETSIEEHLLKDLQWEDDSKDFKNFTRITVTEFEEILALVINLNSICV